MPRDVAFQRAGSPDASPPPRPTTMPGGLDPQLGRRRGRRASTWPSSGGTRRTKECQNAQRPRYTRGAACRGASSATIGRDDGKLAARGRADPRRGARSARRGVLIEGELPFEWPGGRAHPQPAFHRHISSSTAEHARQQPAESQFFRLARVIRTLSKETALTSCLKFERARGVEKNWVPLLDRPEAARLAWLEDESTAWPILLT